MSETPAESAQRIIDDAATRPLRDAAYLLFRRQDWFNRLEEEAEGPYLDQAALDAARARSIARAQLTLDKANTHNGPTFARLKAAHPKVGDDELKAAIKAAVAFDNACFADYPRERGDDWHKAVRAVASAARKNPGYLDVTLHEAANRVAYYMK
jgi:hypothetical protein